MSRRPEGNDPIVRKAGLTYQLVAEEIGTTFTFSRVRRRSDALTGYMSVKTSLDVHTIGNTGILLVGSLNILGPKVRAEFAKQLERKAPGFDVDWEKLLDHMGEQILAMEMIGEPIEEIGDQKVVKTAGAWAIEPWVPKSGACLLYGPGGSGKSRFALAGAMGVQMGRTILPDVVPMLKGNVLYLDWETDRDTVIERIQHICKGVGVPPIRISYRRCVRPLADDVEELAAYCASKKIVLIVVDSAAAATGKQGEYGDANEGALKLFEALRIIGLPAIIVDHVSKAEMRMSGKVRGALPYGSIYKVNMARAAWEVRPVEYHSDDSVHISSFHHTKSNDSRLREPFAIKAEFDEEQVSFALYDGPLTGDEEGDADVRIVAKDVSKRIEELLRGARMRAPEITAYLAPVSPDSVRQALNRGKEKGKFMKDGDHWTVATTKLTALPGGGQVS